MFPKTSKSVRRGIKNVSYLTLGTFFSQVIAFIGFIFIARFLGPNQYGTYLSVTAFVGMFGILTFVGLNKVMVRECSKDLKFMKKYLEKVIGLKNVLSLISILVCIGFSILLYNSMDMRLYIAIYSFILFYQSLESFIQIIFQASEKMYYIAYVSIIHKLIFVILAVLFLYFGYGILSLIIINIISSFLSLAIGFHFSKKIVSITIFSKPEIEMNLITPGIIFSALSFMTFLTKRVDIVMLSFLTTSENVGYYGVAYRITDLMFILRGITSTAFFPIFIKRFKKSPINGTRFIKFSLIFLFALLGIAFILSIFIDDILLIFFGSEYQASGDVFKILIFYTSFWWAVLPFTTAAQAVNKEKLILIAKIIMAIINIILNYIFFQLYGYLGIAYSTLVVFSVGGLILSIIVYRDLKKDGYII